MSFKFPKKDKCKTLPNNTIIITAETLISYEAVVFPLLLPKWKVRANFNQALEVIQIGLVLFHSLFRSSSLLYTSSFLSHVLGMIVLIAVYSIETNVLH